MFQTLITDRKVPRHLLYVCPSPLACSRNSPSSGWTWTGRTGPRSKGCGLQTSLAAPEPCFPQRSEQSIGVTAGTGGNDGDLHQALMERVLIGLDIMPAATHLDLLHAVQFSSLPGIRRVPYSHDALWHGRRRDAHRRARPSRFRACLLPVPHGRVHRWNAIGQPKRALRQD